MHRAVQTCAQLCGLVHSCVHNSAQFVQRVDGRLQGELWRCTQLCRLVHRCVHKSAQLWHRVGGTEAEGQRACTAVCTTLHILCSGSAATDRWGCGCAHTCADLCTAVQTCAPLCAQVCTTRAPGRRHRVEGQRTCTQLCRLVYSCADLCTAVCPSLHTYVRTQLVYRIEGNGSMGAPDVGVGG